jgi:hypothetical protein
VRAGLSFWAILGNARRQRWAGQPERAPKPGPQGAWGFKSPARATSSSPGLAPEPISCGSPRSRFGAGDGTIPRGQDFPAAHAAPSPPATDREPGRKGCLFRLFPRCGMQSVRRLCPVF